MNTYSIPAKATCIITGFTSGIGKVTAVELSQNIWDKTEEITSI